MSGLHGPLLTQCPDALFGDHYWELCAWHETIQNRLVPLSQGFDNSALHHVPSNVPWSCCHAYKFIGTDSVTAAPTPMLLDPHPNLCCQLEQT